VTRPPAMDWSIICRLNVNLSQHTGSRTAGDPIRWNASVFSYIVIGTFWYLTVVIWAETSKFRN